MADNLERQAGTYHVRLAIPKDVQHAFGNRRILSKSLETSDRNEALRLRLPYLVHWKEQIRVARQLPTTVLPEGWQENVANAFAIREGRVQRAGARVAGIEIPEPPDALAFAGEAKPLYTDEYRKALSVPASKLFRDPDDLESRLAFDRTMSSLDTSLLKQYIVESNSLNPSQAAEFFEIADSPTTYKPKSLITSPRIEAYAAHCVTQSISRKHIDTQASRLRQMSAYLNTTGLPLTFDTVAGYLPTLDCSPATKHQYCICGSNFWKWAIKYDATWRATYADSVNPFLKHTFPTLKGRALLESKRKAFTLPELARLHHAASTSHAVLADLILLATYTGARIEELCRLQVNNIVDEDGVRSFDITDSKTRAGIRKVPIHKSLLPVVTRLIADSKDGWLLPINAQNQYGVRSAPLSKVFGRLKQSQGFGRSHVFHSIRMTTITQLQRQGVQGILIAELVGHETGTVTFDVYAQGFSSSQKMVAISAIPALPPLSE